MSRRAAVDAAAISLAVIESGGWKAAWVLTLAARELVTRRSPSPVRFALDAEGFDVCAGALGGGRWELVLVERRDGRALVVVGRARLEGTVAVIETFATTTPATLAAAIADAMHGAGGEFAARLNLAERRWEITAEGTLDPQRLTGLDTATLPLHVVHSSD